MLNALRHRDFFLYWSGGLISFFGTWIQITGFSWLVRSLTDSPALLGLVAFCSSAPMFALSLVGGVLADRLDKKRVISLTQLVLAVNAAALAFLYFSGHIRLEYVMILALLSGIAASIDAPLRQALVYHLVGKEDLSAAIALNSVAFNSARIVGPAIAGALIAWKGEGACFLVNAVSFGAVLIALQLLHVDTRPVATSEASVVSDLKTGFRYSFLDPTLSLLLVMIAVPSLFAFPYATLLPIFARDILGVGAQGFGILLSAAGAGALFGALTLNTMIMLTGRGKVLLLAAVFIGSSLVVLALSTNLHTSMLALVACGFGVVQYAANINALLQSNASDEMRGRVVGQYIFMFLGLSPIGNLIIGTLAQVTSPQISVSAGGGVVVFMAVAVSLVRKDIVSL